MQSGLLEAGELRLDVFLEGHDLLERGLHVLLDLALHLLLERHQVLPHANVRRRNLTARSMKYYMW